MPFSSKAGSPAKPLSQAEEKQILPDVNALVSAIAAICKSKHMGRLASGRMSAPWNRWYWAMEEWLRPASWGRKDSYHGLPGGVSGYWASGDISGYKPTLGTPEARLAIGIAHLMYLLQGAVRKDMVHQTIRDLQAALADYRAGRPIQTPWF
jgi:hypothetical protein